jgi:hypothetical protein
MDGRKIMRRQGIKQSGPYFNKKKKAITVPAAASAK